MTSRNSINVIYRICQMLKLKQQSSGVKVSYVFELNAVNLFLNFSEMSI